MIGGGGEIGRVALQWCRAVVLKSERRSGQGVAR